MEKQTLKELKEQNARADEAPEGDVPEKDAPDLDADQGQEAKKPEAETVDGDEGEPEGEPELWMQSSDDDQKSGFIPNPGVAAVRRKLKAKISEKDEELQKLKAEVEALKSNPQSTQSDPRPKREDFDFDDEAYDEAVDQWHTRQVDQKLSSYSQQSQREAQQQAMQQSVDGHYEKAARLVDSGKVSEEQYRNADRAVRASLDEIFPGQGDALTDGLIHTLNLAGEGSEKVFYQLGVNTSKLTKLKELLRNDPNGLAAASYLGELRSSITAPVKRRSAAPPPAVPVNGEGGRNPTDSLYKEYKKYPVGTTESFRIRRAAKQQGVDVSQW